MNTRIIIGDALAELRNLPPDSVDCCVTSPPYWGLRDYGVDGQIGLESTPAAFIDRLVDVFREVRRVLRPDGTLWLNLGDCYATGAGKVGDHPGGGEQGANWAGAKTQPNRMSIAGLKPKDLVGMPWRVAFALQADGWWLRQDIIWAKPNPMPESVTDRCTKAHEYVFLLTKSERYHFDAEAMAEPAGRPGGSGNKERRPASARGVPVDTGGKSAGGVAGSVPWQGATRNKRSVWTVATQPFKEAHFATFPPALIEPCIMAGCRVGGTVLDPFGGAGTTALVASRLQRKAILIELNPAYAAMARDRLDREAPLLSGSAA